jgi:hypothetical protein
MNTNNNLEMVNITLVSTVPSNFINRSVGSPTRAFYQRVGRLWCKFRLHSVDCMSTATKFRWSTTYM